MVTSKLLIDFLVRDKRFFTARVVLEKDTISEGWALLLLVGIPAIHSAILTVMSFVRWHEIDGEFLVEWEFEFLRAHFEELVIHRDELC